MANHKSAEKRARQNIKRNARNSKRKSLVKTFEKKVLTAMEGKSDSLVEALRNYTSQAMKAVAKGVLKKQTASRKISRLSSRVHKASLTQKDQATTK